MGVQRQYCGAFGKKANCQAAVSLHYVSPAGHVPLTLRLFLPESWLEDPARLDKGGVPAGQRRTLSKGEIVLELLDTIRAENVLSGQVVVGDSGYGVSGPCMRVSPTEFALRADYIGSIQGPASLHAGLTDGVCTTCSA